MVLSTRARAQSSMHCLFDVTHARLPWSCLLRRPPRAWIGPRLMKGSRQLHIGLKMDDMSMLPNNGLQKSFNEALSGPCPLYQQSPHTPYHTDRSATKTTLYHPEDMLPRRDLREEPRAPCRTRKVAFYLRTQAHRRRCVEFCGRQRCRWRNIDRIGE